MNKVTVTGAVVGKNNITLFLQGSEPFMTLPQENWRTKDIMEKVAQIAITMQPLEIDLDDFTLATVLQDAVGNKMKVTTNPETGDLHIQSGNTTLPAKALEMHVERAAVDGSKGLKNFMAKFEVIKRSYTKTELLKFLEHADLPFMDDGSILGFKILQDHQDNGYMVDKHSGKVRQRLGSLVYMPESKVDQSRELCSTGLHIASRNYLSSFWGGNSRLCLVRIQPKDVVSVPIGEESKMRVSAYHIVKVFSVEDGNAIVKGKAIHELPDALRMLEEAVAGNIGPIIERVECRGYGEITVTLLDVKHERIERKKKRSTVTQRGHAKLVSPAQINAMKKLAKLGKKVETWTPAYIKKMAQAQVFFDKGKSLRWIAEKLGIDRDSMTANLDRRPRRKMVA